MLTIQTKLYALLCQRSAWAIIVRFLTEKHTTVTYRSYNSFNEGASELSKSMSGAIYRLTDPNAAPSLFYTLFSSVVPKGAPSRGGDVAVYVFDTNQSSLPTPFYSALVSVYVFMTLSTVFHSINSPNNFPLSHSVLPVFCCLIGPFNSTSLYESLPQPWYNPSWLTGLKAPTN